MARAAEPGPARRRQRRSPAALRLLVVLLTLLGATAARTADDADGALPVLRVPRLDRAPTLGDFLDMEPPPDLRDRLRSVTGFVQRQPEDGRPASQRTHVYLGYDEANLYVIFVAFDDEPRRIRAHMSRRENVFDDETVEIQIDTFNDQRRAYSFLTNPFGIQWDAIWTEGQGFDESWDTVWHSRGALTDRGYVVWMAIPFKSLRFRPGSSGEAQAWRVILVRDIPRNNETSFWPRISSRVEGRLNQSAAALGFEGVSPGRNLWLIPYASARALRLEDDAGQTITDRDSADAGLDAKWVLRDSLALDLTANPDFSQVESDEPQVTVNRRFEVFFPEKRPFFLENADQFASPLDLLFTRRIADPRVGARLTGKLGAYSLGALVIDDEGPGESPDADPRLRGERALNGVVRVRRDVSRQSYVGLIYTDRELGESHNRVGGFDARVKLDDNWDTRAQVVWSATRTLDSERFEDRAFDVAFNRDGRNLDAHIHHIDLGTDFRTELGFVPRTGIRDSHAEVGYNFWREDRRLVRWEPGLFVQRVTAPDGTRLDETLTQSVEWEFRRRTSFAVFGSAGRERLLPEDAPALPEQGRDYSTNVFGAFFETHFFTPVRVELDYEQGRTVNYSPPAGLQPEPADRRFAEIGLTLRPARRLRVDNDYLFTRLEDRASGREILTNRILRMRLNYQFTTRLSLRAILQHDRTAVDRSLVGEDVGAEDNWNGDLLLTYLVNPWTAIYAGYNSNLRRPVIVDDPASGDVVLADSYRNNGRQLFVKLSYLFRP